MTNLNLKAETNPQKLILAYLQENASEVLAEKINNGTPIEKDGKRLINKKDLKGFMNFANSEAKKLADKGATAACIENDVVYGWAIHYFEEDSIEGKLYNEDGSEYKAPAPVKTTAAPTTTPSKPAPKPQLSMFDLLNDTTETHETEDIDDTEDIDEPDEDIDYTDEEETEITQPVIKELPQTQKVTPLYQKYLSVKAKYEDCIVFYRLGDFYEAFGDDAKTAADVLDLTLTGRDCGLDERVPMTGVPFHAVDNYVNKLITKNYKVALCEPAGEQTVERVIGNDGNNRAVDLQTGELLSGQAENTNVESNNTETAETPTVSTLTGDLPDDKQPDEDDDIISESDIKTYFDREVLADLFDVLGDKVDLI